MKTYRAAILGCGGRGTAAGSGYRAHPRTDLVALCDLDQARLDALGEKLGVAARYNDLDLMIEETRPDIVAIPTATEFHYPLAMRVLEHGVNIEVEKPPCWDLAEADSIRAKAQEKGVRFAVHSQGPVGPAMEAVIQAHNEGRIGRLRYVTGSDKGYYAGYGLMNMGFHVIGYLVRLAGRCRSITASAVTGGHPVTPQDVVMSPSGMGTVAGENITATLQFDHSVAATLLLHRLPANDSMAHVVEWYGTEGRLLYNYKLATSWWLPHPHFLPDGERDQWQRLEPVYPDGYDPDSGVWPDEFSYVEEYVRALDEDRDHWCGGDNAVHIMEIMMGVFESVAYRRQVDLPQPHRDHPLLRWRGEHGLDAPAAMPRPYREWAAAEDARIRSTRG